MMMIKGALLLAAGVGFSSAAMAEMNTVELDAAMETCRQHTVSSGGQWVFAPGWEDCNTIEQMWDVKQGGGTKPPDEAAKSAVHNSLMKMLNGQK